MPNLVLFPHQLFHPSYLEDLKFNKIFLVEYPLFFGDSIYPLSFHRQKLILHRASMQSYHNTLISLGYDVVYIDYKQSYKLGSCFGYFISQSDSLIFYDPVDFILEKRIHKYLKDKLNYQLLDTPYFLNTKQENSQYFSNNPFYQHKFYIHQRKKLNILTTQAGKPVGGKWSFDGENRKKLPKNTPIPDTYSFYEENQTLIQEANSYVTQNFPNAIGSAEKFIYPVTHQQAKQALLNFLNTKLSNFGDFEDAIDYQASYLFHSVLTPALNIGLITPQFIIDQTIAFAESHQIPLNSLEGFIRQIISWREFMRATYDIQGVAMRKSNFWNHQNKLPEAFYTANTNILPIDNTIQKLLKTAYSHHIERLMVLGNFMCLCQIHPTEVYKWFMEMYIDAYDWVMVPNVYAMSQFADGGSITTKPYISSANYINKMSNYPKGEWQEIWTSLYWNFIHTHREFFQSNFRLNMMVKMLDKMPKDKQAKLFKQSSEFLNILKNT